MSATPAVSYILTPTHVPHTFVPMNTPIPLTHAIVDGDGIRCESFTDYDSARHALIDLRNAFGGTINGDALRANNGRTYLIVNTAAGKR